MSTFLRDALWEWNRRATYSSEILVRWTCTRCRSNRKWETGSTKHRKVPSLYFNFEIKSNKTVQRSRRRRETINVFCQWKGELGRSGVAGISAPQGWTARQAAAHCWTGDTPPGTRPCTRPCTYLLIYKTQFILSLRPSFLYRSFPTHSLGSFPPLLHQPSLLLPSIVPSAGSHEPCLVRPSFSASPLVPDSLLVASATWELVIVSRLELQREPHHIPFALSYLSRHRPGSVWTWTPVSCEGSVFLHWPFTAVSVLQTHIFLRRTALCGSTALD